MTNNKCTINFANITNLCINLGYWPLHFKKSILIIISKLNKLVYDSSKMFYLIILLNILGKLIKKAMSKRLQIYSIVSNFVYPNQLGGIKQQSTLNTGLYLIYLICIG